MEERLSKKLAAAGIASRRKCEEIIFNGRVTVNNKVIIKPEHHVSDRDVICVDGERIRKQNKVYYMLNKPRGYICSAASKKSVLTLMPPKQRLFTVGRLDKDTEGLIIITNDGDFAHKVIHPSSNIHKEYLVKVDREVFFEHLEKINEGTFVEGAFVKPVKITKIRRGTMKIVVSEGRKHEVRQLVEAAGLEVKELKRIRIGGLQLGSLPTGSWRNLTNNEISMLCKETPSKN